MISGTVIVRVALREKPGGAGLVSWWIAKWAQVIKEGGWKGAQIWPLLMGQFDLLPNGPKKCIGGA